MGKAAAHGLEADHGQRLLHALGSARKPALEEGAQGVLRLLVAQGRAIDPLDRRDVATSAP